jgi:hypothetical protein
MVIPTRISFRSVTPPSEHPYSLTRDTQIFYANNGTNMSAHTALTTSWIGPSITPLTNLNSGFRVYEVDSAVRAFVFPRFSPVNLVFLRSDIRHHGRSHVSYNSDPSERRERLIDDAGGGVTYTHTPGSMGKHLLVPRMYTSMTLVQPTVRVSLGGIRAIP